MNLVDQPRAASLWREQDRDLYNRLPIYFNKRVVEYVKYYDTWAKLLKPTKWTPNMGTTMKGINRVPAPILRGQALPNPITQTPKKDVIEVRETDEDTQVYRHFFESDLFDFLPSFIDFLEHVDVHSDAIAEKVITYKDLFYRTAIFHGSPYVWICNPTDGGKELRAAPYWTSPTIALSKTAAYLQSVIGLVGGGLSLENVKKFGTVFETDLGAKPFQGGVRPDGSNGQGLQSKFLLLTGTEVWDGFTNAGTGDYLLNNKALDLDIVTDSFKGSLFGKFTTKHERYEMRIKLDGTISAPETVEENGNAYDYGDTVPFSDYVDSPIGVAFGIANEPYNGLQVGPPPSKFAQGASMSMKEFNGMDWSGKVSATRNVLIPSINEAGATVLDTNKRGEKMQLLADAVMGVSPIRRRHVVPIFYLRDRVNT